MKADQLEQLLHENECTYLDFKQAQYPFAGENDEVKSELLKDILALANAEKNHDGFILIGVQENRGGRAKILGVASHLNDHDLQQFVDSKTQRPLVFSYEVAPCDGASIGIIRVPIQQRPLFLKNDFGKLRKSIVYYRLGSSTKDASPDDLWRWGQQAATNTDEPKLEIQFAQIRRRDVVGGSLVTKPVGTTITVQTRNTSPLTNDQIRELIQGPPQFEIPRTEAYFKEFGEFLRTGFLFAPLGLVLVNSGEATAVGVKVKISPTSKVFPMILSEEKYRIRPLNTRNIGLFKGGLRASHTKLRNHDIVVREESGTFEIDWNIPKALPKLPIISEGIFFLGSSQSGLIELNCSIFAENLRQPVQTTLSVTMEKVQKDLTVEEVEKLSESFTFADIETDAGRLA